METLLILIGGIAAIFGIIIYDSFAWGFVLYKFYGWFLIGVFTNLPHIDFYQAVGVMLVISLFKNQGVTKFKNENIGEIKMDMDWITLILNPWICLLSGYIVSLFI